MTSVDLSAQQKDFCGMSDVAVTTSIFVFFLFIHPICWRSFHSRPHTPNLSQRRTLGVADVKFFTGRTWTPPCHLTNSIKALN